MEWGCVQQNTGQYWRGRQSDGPYPVVLLAVLYAFNAFESNWGEPEVAVRRALVGRFLHLL